MFYIDWTATILKMGDKNSVRDQKSCLSQVIKDIEWFLIME